MSAAALALGGGLALCAAAGAAVALVSLAARLGEVAALVSPRHPAASMTFQALWGLGLAKVEPPVFSRMGWEASRAAVIRSISAMIAAGSPGLP
jgi:hypothetical protein